MKALRSLLLLTVAATALAGQGDKTYDLIWKPVKGTEYRYHVTVDINTPGTPAKLASDLNVKVMEVAANGDYNLEVSTTNVTIKIGDTETKSPSDKPEIEKYNAHGDRIGAPVDQPEDKVSEVLSAITDLATPPKPVKVGDTWTKEIKPNEKIKRNGATLVYRLMGSDKDHTHISFSYKETAPGKVKGGGNFWLDPTDFALFKLDANVTGVKIDEDAPEAKAEFKLTKF